MTDKQIIIDGVDVSECRQYMPRYMEDYDIDTLDYCRHYFKPCKDVDVKYCYYKQLKRKEQECEKLKAKIKYMEEYIKTVENARNEFEKESNFLKEENKRLKQTLTEIKEIAKKHKATAYCDYLTDMDNILQKISECEV